MGNSDTVVELSWFTILLGWELAKFLGDFCANNETQEVLWVLSYSK